MAKVAVQPNPNIRVPIVLADPGFLVVDKPCGMVTQPGKGHESDSLLNGLAAAYGPLLQGLGKARDWGLLHRLDREASGLLLVGLRTRAYDALRTAFEERRIEKRYWAIVFGKPPKDAGVIRAPIKETTSGKARMKTAEVSRAAAPGAQRAITAYRVLDTTGKASLLECRLGTGRLHQIRAHMEWLGCPVIGDGLYGARTPGARGPRLALHACHLGFAHPETGAPVSAWSEWPRDLSGTLRRLGLRRPHPGGPADVSTEDSHTGEDAED